MEQILTLSTALIDVGLGAIATALVINVRNALATMTQTLQSIQSAMLSLEHRTQSVEERVAVLQDRKSNKRIRAI